MIIVPIKNVIYGKRTAYPIIDSRGMKILAAGVELTTNYIERVEKMGIKALCMLDPLYDDIQLKEPIFYETRNAAMKIYKDCAEDIAKNRTPNGDAIKDLAKKMVEEVRNSGLPVLILNAIYQCDDLLVCHAINTAIISVAIGLKLNYNFGQLCDLCIAAFIHDIGRTSLDDDSNQDHGMMAFEALRKVSVISIVASSSTIQHHENYDGTGIPRGIKGDAICESTRIVSVADYFDSLITGQAGTKLSYESAYEEVLKSSEKRFDPAIIEAFENVIQIYMDGARVTLSDGRDAYVVSQNKENIRMPVVRACSKDIFDYSKDIDLAHQRNLKIMKIHM